MRVLPADVMVQYYYIISPSKKVFLVSLILAIQAKPVYETAQKGVALHLSLYVSHDTHLETPSSLFDVKRRVVCLCFGWQNWLFSAWLGNRSPSWQRRKPTFIYQSSMQTHKKKISKIWQSNLRTLFFFFFFSPTHLLLFLVA